jgi:hypothetical protein
MMSRSKPVFYTCHYCEARIPEAETYTVIFLPPANGPRKMTDNVYYCHDDYEMIRANLLGLQLKAPLFRA